MAGKPADVNAEALIEKINNTNDRLKNCAELQAERMTGIREHVDSVEKRTNERIDAVGQQSVTSNSGQDKKISTFGAKFDKLEKHVGERMDTMDDSINVLTQEVKEIVTAKNQVNSFFWKVIFAVILTIVTFSIRDYLAKTLNKKPQQNNQHIERLIQGNNKVNDERLQSLENNMDQVVELLKKRNAGSGSNP